MEKRYKKDVLPELFTIGQVTKPHGVRGTVRVIPETEFSEQFENLKSVFLRCVNGEILTLNIKDVKNSNRFILLAFDGIDDRDDAETLRDAQVLIERDEYEKLSNNGLFFSDIRGFDVFSHDDVFIGQLEDVESYPAHDIFIIKTNEKSIMVPAVPEFVKNIDTRQQKITIHLIDGLLD